MQLALLDATIAVFEVVFVVFDVVVIIVVVVVHVVVDPTNLPLKFGLNRARNSYDMNDIEFVVVVCGGWWSKVIFVSHPTFELSWGCDNSRAITKVIILTKFS